MNKIFQTWTFKGVRFLAIDRGGDTQIVDENGGNYGAWLSGVEGFRKRQEKGDAAALEVLNPAPLYKPVSLMVKVS